MIGQSLPRVDGFEKVTGRARYTSDFKLPGMLFAKIVRSPIAAGRIVSIDATKALSCPGVIAVLTGEDLKDIDPYFGHAVRDRPILAIDRVRYIGEPVAVVAAESEQEAEDALTYIDIEYEELPAVFDPINALEATAPLVHERSYGTGGFHGLKGVNEERTRSNVCFRHEERTGDVEEAMQRAAVVYENVYYFPPIYHYAMEPHAALAVWSNEGVEITACAQHPFIVRQEIAEMFGLPLHAVRLHTPYIGGGFGSKSYTKVEPIAVAMSRKAGRPVMLSLSVHEAFHTTRRHAAVVSLKVGLDPSGRLLARHCRVVLNTGAYADNGPRVAHWAAQEVLGPYRCPNDYVESIAVYTNTTPAGSFRAIGGPQTIWACESHMDSLAKKIGMDRLQFRLLNLPEAGEVLRPGRKPMESNLRVGLQRAAEKAGWQDEPDDKGHAWGIGTFLGEAGATAVSVALMRLQADGTVSVYVGTSELGQGSRTVLAQIAAEELGLPLDAVAIRSSDTDNVPFDRSTGASRSTTVMGSAVQAAARDLLDQVRDIAETMQSLGEMPPPGNERQEYYRRVIRAYYGMPGGELVGRGYGGPHGLKQLNTKPVFWEAAYGIAKISLDRETGMIRLEQYTAASEVGKAINPVLVKGQEQGAFMMGLGNTLYEEVVEEAGEIRNPNLIDYRVPQFTDLPVSMQTMMFENEDGPGPYGSRGVGEGNLSPVGPAVGNALAVLIGKASDRLPLTPERVWRLMREASNDNA